jgi:RNA polymerase sigma-70 factor (ECF subfamily)
MKSQSLTVSYTGRSGKTIQLRIEDCPCDPEIRSQIKDPTCEAAWKTVYLDSYYEEMRNDENQRKKCSELSAFEFEDARHFDAGIDVVEEVISNDTVIYAISHLNERQQYLIRKCCIESWSYTDLAKLEGKDESAIRHAVNRAKKKLKGFL